MNAHHSISRRAALTGGLATGFLLAFHLPLRAAVNEPVQPRDTTDGKFAPNAFIRIDETGRTVLIMPQVEMGQGTYTSISAVLAEELDADWSKVEVQHAPPDDKLYGNPTFGLQVTGNSNSIRAWWLPLRKAGATARAMLVQAAAAEWGVDPASCTAAKGEVAHAASGRKLAYGALALAARGQTPPKDAALKDPKDFVLIGQPLKRLDTPDKVNGKAIYGIDAILPGMKFATVAACPVFGGKVGKVDDSAAVKLPGVRKVVVLEDMVAVIGDHMWAAKKGLSARDRVGRRAERRDHHQGRLGRPAQGQPEGRRNRQIRRRHRQGAGERRQVRGGLRVALPGARLDGADQRHGARETDSCDIWTGTQIMTRVQSEAAKAAGLPIDKVIVNNHLLGGGFGRKLEPDMVVAAVKIAKQVDYPVKVVWTREEDIQHDVYRPVYRDEITASLVDGKVAGWKYKVAGSAVLARWLPPAFQKGIDIDAIDAAVDAPYDFANFHVEYVRAEPLSVPTGFWRGVGPNNNVFAVECAMDELARKAGKDPIEFRKSMLTKNPRMLAVLDQVAEKSGWGNPCRRASAAASACSRHSQASSRRWWRRRSTTSARSRSAASPRWSTPASPSTPTP